ncbi:MAG: N-acetylneuraminate synthase family protein [Tepidisphaeraceae bacterium]|jgi:sialic acid synthase SpsE
MKKSLSIGPKSPVLVIAEIGVNHDGSLAKALKLVRAAKKAGADAVKLQLFRADRLMHPSCDFAKYQKQRSSQKSAIEMLRQYELTDDQVRKIAAEVKSAGLWLLATPFSLGDLPLLESLNTPAIKIASPDLVNKPLLHAASKLGLPLLISTGAAEMLEIVLTHAWLASWKAPFALFHCISSYPTRLEDAHLSWIGELRDLFGVPVGFSDHTSETICGALAVAAGARLIEKHLTLDCRAPGPDHAASLDVPAFTEYVRLIRLAEASLGTPGKRVLPAERDVRRVSRQSLVIARPVAKGTVLGEADFTVQRPGTGVLAARIDEFVGKTATRALTPGQMFNPNMIA